MVLFVVLDGEDGLVDQRALEAALLARGVAVVRATLEEIGADAAVGDDGALVLRGREVALVYFRAGYMPGHYRSERAWAARAAIERSRADASPSAALHLAGSKAVQQALCDEAVLARFTTRDERAVLDGALAHMDRLAGSPAADALFERLCADEDACARLVVKPQREGGGNNVYGRDIAAFLRGLPPAERAGYVTMDLIQPSPFPTTFVLHGATRDVPRATWELGIFTTYLETEAGPRESLDGYLMRTKDASSNEGGVTAGFACLDAVVCTHS